MAYIKQWQIENKTDETDELYSKIYAFYYVPIRLDVFNYLDIAEYDTNGYLVNLKEHYLQQLHSDLNGLNSILDESYRIENSLFARACIFVGDIPAKVPLEDYKKVNYRIVIQTDDEVEIEKRI